MPKAQDPGQDQTQPERSGSDPHQAERPVRSTGAESSHPNPSLKASSAPVNRSSNTREQSPPIARSSTPASSQDQRQHRPLPTQQSQSSAGSYQPQHSRGVNAQSQRSGYPPEQYSAQPQIENQQPIRQSGQVPPVAGASKFSSPPQNSISSSPPKMPQNYYYPPISSVEQHIQPSVKPLPPTPQQSLPQQRSPAQQQTRIPEDISRQKPVEVEALPKEKAHPDAGSADNTSYKKTTIRPWMSPFIVVLYILLFIILLEVFFIIWTFVRRNILSLTFAAILVVFVLIITIAGILYEFLRQRRQKPEEEFEASQSQEDTECLNAHVTEPQDQLETEVERRENVALPDHIHKHEPDQQPRAQENEARMVSQPLLSVYDDERDPPAYDKEKIEHPHQRLYPAQESEKSELGFSWRIIGASRRGYGHAYTGKYREDDFAIRIFSGDDSLPYTAVVVAIADGVGSKEYSRYGALAAVEGATKFSPRPAGDDATAYDPDSEMRKLFHLIANHGVAEEYETQAYAILYQALHSAQLNVVERAAQHKPELSTDDLHSTLLLFLVVPLAEKRLFVASTQVGDGALFSLKATGQQPRERWNALQLAQIQESGNEVQPFMRSQPKTWKHFFKCEVLEDVIFVMGMTDGTADDIEPPRATPDTPDPDPFIYVNDFYKHIRSEALGKEQSAQALGKFLEYKKVQSYDDRTVICLYNENLQ